jgi:hypothetical protein
VEAHEPGGGPAREVALPPGETDPLPPRRRKEGEPGSERSELESGKAGEPGSEEGAVPPRPPGAVVVEGESGPLELSQRVLLERAARIAGVVAGAGERARMAGGAAERAGLDSRAVLGGARRSPPRAVLVSCRPLADPGERALLAWATLAGAALVLEPDPASLVATAAWARPTLFAGTVAEIAALRRVVERGRRGSRGSRRLPLRRLRLLLPRGPDPLDPAEASFWQAHGVEIAAGVL